ncbi:LysE family translocator [Glycomyces algeriensis]|uniref:Threonine transporter RhtB n=1 Tax=Glycomyces algeriensis TaxID=256037 RepID=A0A9W6GD99_9ACTN|nr:LysE family translocator [Glycomyces algeriensis]MDA1367808.1 LysE family translocator [Glycomyces algeriensis]MDR7351954.1 threonine/homoserine/homoserine lactone efflux protein [Glycomyces algeriensis]GLI44687.1 threonine transporter RhtB [Glycomyces algeriensis]
MPEALFAFALAIVPIVVTPGASFTLMATHVLGDERGVVRRVAAGTAAGILTHAVLAACGLSALVMQSAELYRAVQFAGAAYLIALGIVTIARRDHAATAPEASAGPRLRIRTAYLANLLNPKAAAVYLTLAPQFLDHRTFTAANLIALAAVHAALTVLWLTLGATALRSLGKRALALPRRAFDTIGGAVLIALGARTLVQAHSGAPA